MYCTRRQLCEAVKTVNIHLTQTSARYFNLPQLLGYRILNLSAPDSKETCELPHPVPEAALSVIKQLYAKQSSKEEPTDPRKEVDP